jgi:hypothetical protein
MVSKLIAIVVGSALVVVAVGAGLIFLGQPTPVVVNPPQGAAPTVSSASPQFTANGTPLNTRIVATFDQPMDPNSITTSTFMVKRGATDIAGTVTYSGKTATFTPSANLAASAAHSATLTTGVKNLTGRALAANYVWNFTTGLAPDTTPAVVASTSPVFAAGVNGDIAVTFNEAMDPSTITASTFLVKQGTTPVLGTVTYSGLTATFHPSAPLAANTAYAVTITTGAKDLSGNALGSGFVYTLTTSPSASACGQLPVNIGSTSTFAVLAGSTVTNTGGSTVTGDLGLSPGSDVTGFPPGNVVGTLHVADTAAGVAIGDLTIAYNDAAGRTLCPVSIAGNIGGQTLTPGLYKSTSGLEVTSGDLTLDARGAASGVFIFQMASTLVTTDGRQVILSGGALASNVFWQVGTSASFGTHSVFVGTVMADQSISFDTGSSLSGRALARIGAVTLDETTVTSPGAIPPVIDTTPPTVISTSSAVAVLVGSNITATFSETMDPTTITGLTFTIDQGATSVPGVVSYTGMTATFNPTADLSDNTTYNATVTVGAKDLAGNALLANHSWSLQTAVGVSTDTTPPTVVSTSARVGLAIGNNVFATFSEAMDPATIAAASTFTLAENGTPVSGAVSYAGVTATLNPGADLMANTTYTATVSTAAKDVAGNALAAPFVWNFTTANPACGQTAVDLGSAADFAVLAGSTVTNTGLTNVTGDLGVSPGTAVTGFGPGVVNGTIHAGDGAAAGAIANLTTAYNDAAGRTLCAILVSGNLGGQTLTPGLYTSSSGLEISSGDLYLDAQGDANAVFIFQMATTLDVAANLHVYLVNGTKASNVFWQVGTSATLGTDSTFAGTIMADQSISLGTRANLEGRALARIGGVSLDACIVTKPSP